MNNYYNENDPYCAQWLRNLIAAGHIAPGDVDERSIIDVKPDDLTGYDQCHFFAGIGGWSYALRIAGWPNDCPVWTGSCPCQPLSGMGQRKGHIDERHLWPAFHALIAECSPATVFGEQVASKDGCEWFSAIRIDLEELGYAVGGANLCGAAAGSPQIRQRLFFVANSLQKQKRTWRFNGMQESQRNPWAGLLRPPRSCVANGISRNVDQVGAFGNAIIPQIAAEFIIASI